jgi:phosphoglycolate phosphatase
MEAASMPKKYRLAVFDFDGTLADSFPFFVGVLDELAAQHGFRKIEPEGLGALRSWTARQVLNHVGLPIWKLPLVARSFMALMNKNATAIPLFEDVHETLHHLVREGMTLAIVTANSRDNVHRILGPENVRLIEHFECGAPIFGKHVRIRKVLGRSAIPALEAIYIGDQPSDADAARREGVAFGAVSWGYGSIESLQAHTPDELFDHVRAIRRIA